MNHQVYIARKENKLKQVDVAKKLGMHKQTYYQKENGISDFTIAEAKRLAIIFNSTLDELFGEGVNQWNA